ncbi:hypothetical protein T459_31755 [Capsicum annuum]|uniref:Uncharacterized protein n=1 Tax=Capsicum annuum TaxID=4072 RepID=A0A2G2Y3U3_CAPAN|nr:hypothetical protein T459_31755 [Capsicum annuum]
MPGPTLNATALYTLQSFDGVLSLLDNRVTYDNGPANPPTTFILGPKFLETYLYHLSPNKGSAATDAAVMQELKKQLNPPSSLKWSDNFMEKSHHLRACSVLVKTEGNPNIGK